MARTTYVKRAQQRYATVPVTNEDGTPKRVPVMRKDGTQKTTKRGQLVFMTVTRQDKSQPLPNRKCEKCGAEIEPGQPYKYIDIRTTYGGYTRYRCGTCPAWQRWEVSNSLSAQLERVSNDFSAAINGVEDPEDVRTALAEAAEAVREIAQEKEQGADNIEEGFGHATYQSDELREQAEALNSWADEIEATDVPELPEPEDEDCPTCNGTGLEQMTEECPECGGAGHVSRDEPTEDQIAEWQSEVEDACSIVDESPV